MTGLSRIPAVRSLLGKIPVHSPFLVLEEGEPDKLRECFESAHNTEEPMANLTPPAPLAWGKNLPLILDSDEIIVVLELIDYYERRRLDSQTMRLKLEGFTNSKDAGKKAFFSGQAQNLEAMCAYCTSQVATLTAIVEGGIERGKRLMH